MIVSLFSANVSAEIKNMENFGKDISKMYLLSTKRIDREDGSYIIEKTYVDKPFTLYSTIGTVSYVKRGSAVLPKTVLVEYEVEGTFNWDSKNKTVTVSSSSGRVTYNQGGDITGEEVTTHGNGSRRARVNYKFKRTTNLGFSTNYSISVGCDSKGSIL